MGHARKFGAFNLYLILFVFFGSEVNICSEETVVGEFEVRYPITCNYCEKINISIISCRWFVHNFRAKITLPCHGDISEELNSPSLPCAKNSLMVLPAAM